MGAMLKVQGKIDGVRKDSKNPHFRSSYASLEAVVDTIRPACQDNKIVVMQAPGEFSAGCIAVETMLTHSESGEWIRSTLHVPVQKQDPQGIGSALTYAERYSLMALFNLPPVDDDGQAASAAAPQQSQSTGVVPNAAERQANGLITTLNSATDAADLQSIKDDSEFREKFSKLPKHEKDRVLAHMSKVEARHRPAQTLLEAG